ncbi:porin [Neisseria sp. Marseille-Q5346]|uniref:porin n=1 Tax=unclassified Neisseria TaxID=2623750 RepID=UPI0021E0FB35|nr:porin [Neisseria sp. Marseille-Q5346]
MNLKLLLTAALSTAALAAHADVQLYGSIKSGIETSQTRFSGQTYSRTAVADQGSHIGLRGSHPIGGGTNFIWEVEQDTPVGKSGSIRQDWRERRDNFGR